MRTVLGIVVALAALETGCWHSNRPTAVAVADEGTMGYGTRTDTRGMWLLFAWSETSVTNTGTAAAAVSEGTGLGAPDLVWHCHPHGFELCAVANGGMTRCMPATGATVPLGICVIQDPVNLGTSLAVTRGSTSSGYGYSYSYTSVWGSIVMTSSGFPTTRAAGVWISTLGGEAHCQVENGAPVCRAITAEAIGMPRTVQTIVRGGERVDVIWYAGPSRMTRCEASLSQPEPLCQVAMFE